MQQHGFARDCHWEIVATSAKLGMGEDDVGIMFRLTDNEYTRSMWDFPFELTYEVLLGTRSVMCKLTVANPGDTTFPFTAALHPYIGTVPTTDTRVNVVVRLFLSARVRVAVCSASVCVSVVSSMGHLRPSVSAAKSHT
jgi:D-hexose-6-phosphate mutarotase